MEAFNYLTNSHQRLFWLYILSSLLISAVVMILKPEVRATVFSKKLWLHTSAKLDYSYFVISLFIKVFLILPMMVSAAEIAYMIVPLLQNSFGYVERIHMHRLTLTLVYTFSLFVVSDFTRYWLHRAEHSIEFLWKIHKIHHAAEVLTPITFYRVHPIENILFGIRYAISAGVVTGVFLYLFGAGLHVMDVMGANIFVFVFGMLGSNLRHSHVPLHYPKVVELFFISPSAHQIHHSVEGLQTNFGGYLAIWDSLFKTRSKSLHVDSKIGLDERVEHTLKGLLLSPFFKGVKI